MDEAGERAARLECELEVVKSKNEQAEAKLATLELHMQSGKKKGEPRKSGT